MATGSDRKGKPASDAQADRDELERARFWLQPDDDPSVPSGLSPESIVRHGLAKRGLAFDSKPPVSMDYAHRETLDACLVTRSGARVAPTSWPGRLTPLLRSDGALLSMHAEEVTEGEDESAFLLPRVARERWLAFATTAVARFVCAPIPATTRLWLQIRGPAPSTPALAELTRIVAVHALMPTRLVVELPRGDVSGSASPFHRGASVSLDDLDQMRWVDDFALDWLRLDVRVESHDDQTRLRRAFDAVGGAWLRDHLGVPI